MSLIDARLSSLIHELSRLRAEISFFRDSVRTIGIAIQSPVMDDRELLRRTAIARARLDALRPRLENIAGQIPQLSRATHRRGSTSSFGHLGNLRGNLPVVERELEMLEGELESVQAKVLEVMNDPLRTSSTPTGSVIELLDLAFTLTRMVLEHFRRSRT